jgi:hypothetical protein
MENSALEISPVAHGDDGSPEDLRLSRWCLVTITRAV